MRATKTVPAGAMAQAKPGAGKRSPHWPAFRAAILKKRAVCEGCGGKKELECHHRLAFHVHPELELRESNIVVLCEHSPQNCHWHFGHNALSWKCFNVKVREDATLFSKRRSQARYA